MTTTPADRTRTATPDLQILDRWENATAWLIEHSAKWPKSHRFTFAQRTQNLALEVMDLLVEARYVPKERVRLLHLVNRDLERLRHLLRMAERLRVMPTRGFELAMRQVDEVGRMAHGWRTGTERPRASGSPRQEAGLPCASGEHHPPASTAAAEGEGS